MQVQKTALCGAWLYINNINDLNKWIFFNSYAYRLLADKLWALHVVIISINEIIAFFLPSKYLFHLTVGYLTKLYTVHPCVPHNRHQTVLESYPPYTYICL